MACEPAPPPPLTENALTFSIFFPPTLSPSRLNWIDSFFCINHRKLFNQKSVSELPKSSPLHLVLRKTRHPTSRPSPSSLRWSSSLYQRLPVVCLEASIFFVKFSTPIAWYHLLLSFHQSLKACSILVLALPVSSTAGAGRGPDGLLGGSLQMMIYILWWSVCLSVTKNDHFLKRSVFLFVCL